MFNSIKKEDTHAAEFKLEDHKLMEDGLPNIGKKMT